MDWHHLVLAAAVATAPGSAAKGNPPTEIAGTWEVEHVAVDGEDSLHWEMRPDDPREMGRTLVIAPAKVKYESGKRLDCQQSTWPPRRTTWGFLLAKGFPRPAMGGRSPTPTPRDFELKVGKGQGVTTYSLCPQAGRDNRFPQDHWIALQGPEQIALHLDNQVLLLLRRRATDAKPQASFDCAKAATPTEKTICGSFQLASWDRSVALAFRRSLENQPPEKLPELRAAQKQWLHERDQCGANAECIDDHQWRRVDALLWDP
jgi:uncharacterized protein YecT (DUF1311 family)